MRKLHKLTNTKDKTGRVYLIVNLKKFCEDNGIVYRNIFYTRNGERNVANGWKLLESLNVYSFEERWNLKNVYNNNFEEVFPDDVAQLCYMLHDEPHNDRDCATKQDKKDVLRNTKPSRAENEDVSIKSQDSDKDETLDRELVKARKQIQSLQDKLRIERKVNREVIRKDNIQSRFEDSVVEILQKEGLGKVKQKDIFGGCYTSRQSLIIQLSDLHFGKVVDLPNNQFNMRVAKERLNTYYKKVRRIIECEDITTVDIILTGDMFNNEHHIDSLLTNEDTRAKNFIEGVDIVAEFIEKIHDIPEIQLVVVGGVVGNESRIKGNEYQSNVSKIANNNFDTMMFGMLKRLYKNVDSIAFYKKCDALYEVRKIADGVHVAYIHGDKLKRHTDDEILKMKIKLEERYGVKINHVIMGHIHSTAITSNWSRSGSLVGIDEYASDSTLNIPVGCASQNVYYVDKDNKTVEGREIKLDL